MQFAEPKILHILWFLPVLAWGLHLAHERRRSMIDRFVHRDLLPESSRLENVRQGRVKAIFIMVFYVFSVLALARPQWGYEIQEVKRQGLDILIAVDVSKSMLTQDVKPSRLERTKLAIKDLVKKLKSDRLGLIAFAGNAFLICPLTIDYNGFLLSLNDLSTDTIPRGGTNLSFAIDEAIKGHGNKGQAYKTLVLVTDGEDQEGDVVHAAKQAKDKGIKIFTVGIGTQEGDLIQFQGDQGQMVYLKDVKGDYVKSRLNENLLQQIAYITGGAYVRSSGAQFGLDYIYEQQLSKLEKHETENKQEKKYHERFQWFLSIALIALFFLSL